MIQKTPYDLSPALFWPFRLHLQPLFLLFTLLSTLCVCVCVCMYACSFVSDSQQHHRLQPTRLHCPCDFPDKTILLSLSFFHSGIFHCLFFSTQNVLSSHIKVDYILSSPRTLLIMLLSHFSSVRLCATPQTAAHQAPPCLGFSRQEYWSGLPFPSPMDESEK